MFEKIKEKLAELAKQNQQMYTVDTSQFNDPIAEKTDWFPLKPGGANFKTHTLKSLSANLMKYTMSTGGKVFLGLFAFIGIITITIGTVMLFLGEGLSFFLIVFGSIFFGVSLLMYKTMGKPIFFDAKMGVIWIGKNPPKFAGDNNLHNSLVYFSKIQAIQIISERVRGNKHTYRSYEINLILKDGKRFNVVDHGNHGQILIDAEKLSAFIGKPIWNIT